MKHQLGVGLIGHETRRPSEVVSGRCFRRGPPVPRSATPSAATAAALRASLSHSVGKLDVFPHRAGVGVALCASGDFAGVRFTRDVGLHVFCTVAGVIESLVAVLVVAGIRLLSCVGPNMELEVLQAREGATAVLDITLVGFLTRVTAEVRDEFVSSVERFPLALTVLPEAAISDHCRCVSSIQMSH